MCELNGTVKSNYGQKVPLYQGPEGRDWKCDGRILRLGRVERDFPFLQCVRFLTEVILYYFTAHWSEVR